MWLEQGREERRDRGEAAVRRHGGGAGVGSMRTHVTQRRGRPGAGTWGHDQGSLPSADGVRGGVREEPAASPLGALS